MSEFPENYPLSEDQPAEQPSAPQATGQADIDAFANLTPVGATKAARKAAGGKRSGKKWPIFVAAIAAVAVLASAVFWLPPLLGEDEPEPEPDLPDTSVTLIDKQLGADGKELTTPIKSIHVASRIDEFTLALGEDNTLRLQGEDTLPVNSTAVEDLVELLTLVTAKDTVKENVEDLAEYGLTAPTATVDVTYADDTTAKLELASLAIGSHYYLRLNGGNTVYLLDSSLPDKVMQTAEAFIGYTMIAAPSVSSEDPNGGPVLKELSLTGPVRDNVITTVRRLEATDGDEFKNSSHILVAPHKLDTDTAAVNKVFAVTSVSALEVVALHPTEAEKAQYGLDNPQSVAKIVLSVYTYTQNDSGETESAGYYNTATHMMLLGNKNEDGDYYAMADTMDVIYLVDDEDVPWAEMTYHDFANQYLFLRNLDTLSSISCKFEGKEYDFRFTHNPEEKELDDQLTVTMDGKQYSTPEFRVLYQVLMTLVRTGEAPAAPTGEPLLTVRITSTDTAISAKTVSIYPYSGSVYIAQSESGDTYKVTASGVDDAIAQIKNYLNGDPVVNKW